MKKVDFIFAILSGLGVGYLFRSFIVEAGVKLPFMNLIFLVGFPVVAIIGLGVAWLIGKKILAIFQAAKFLLLGALATLVDLYVFDFFFWVFGSAGNVAKLAAKIISFFVATIAKYGGNKYWAFEKTESRGIAGEFAQFLIVTLIGAGVDVGIFYLLTNIIGTPAAIPLAIWTRISVILSAILVAVWNFLGYKFFVFKK